MKDLNTNDITYNFADCRLPRYREIPDVGLLLEQTVRLVNSYLEPFGDIKLTGSMVSNYVKQKIIGRPVRKMYNREQIAALIFIALSKTVLSLDEITWILKIQQDSYDIDTAFDYFCRELEKAVQTRFHVVSSEILGTGLEIPEKKESRDKIKTDGSDKINSGAVDKNAEEGDSSSAVNGIGNDAYLVHCLIMAITDGIHLRYVINQYRNEEKII